MLMINKGKKIRLFEKQRKILIERLFLSKLDEKMLNNMISNE